MKIVHVSFGRIKPAQGAKEFLSRISYFTGILEEQAKHHEVFSFYFLNEQTEFADRGVHYRFVNGNVFKRLFPLALARIVRRLNADVVIIHGTHFTFQSLLIRICIGKERLIFLQHHAENTQGVRRLLLSISDLFVDGYFFVSRLQAPAAIRKKVLEVMEVSSVFKRVAKSVARDKISISNKKTFLWIGRLDRNKDPLTALKAFTRFSSTRNDVQLFLIFQSGELLPDVSEFVTGANAPIVLAGAVEHRQMELWFSAADFIISTSHREGSGVAVCEAMSCGAIPIVTDIASFRRMTGGGLVGMLFPPGDADALYERLVVAEGVNVDVESTRTWEYFSDHLSFEAIASTVDGVIRKQIHKLSD